MAVAAVVVANLSRSETAGERTARLKAEREQRRIEDQVNAKSTKRYRQEVLADKRQQAAEARADRAIERAQAKVERARATGTGTKTATAKVEAAEKKVEHLEDIASRIEAGNYSPSELRELMKGGILHFKNPGTPASFDAACSMANAEAKQCGVAVLTAAEQKKYGLPRYAVAVGPLEQISYERGGTIFDHKAGDVGGLRKSTRKSYVVADPRNGKVSIVGGHLRFEDGWLKG